jgi:hypothetical protein
MVILKTYLTSIFLQINLLNKFFRGKPLPGTYEDKSNINDPTEEWCYKLLKRNGFAPEWVELNKGIHAEKKQAIIRLT